jgi:hypothetical protein
VWVLIARHWVRIAGLVLPVVTWNFAGMWLNGSENWLWLVERWPYSRGSAYGSGNLFQLVALLPVAVGPLVMPFVIAGACSWRHDRRVLGVAAIGAALIVGHSIIWWLGLMSSFGEIRYLTLAAPIWGVLGATGWERMREVPLVRSVRPLLLATVGIVVVFSARVTWLRQTPETSGVCEVANWLIATRPNSAVTSSHPGVWVHAGIRYRDAGRFVPWEPSNFSQAPAGTILVWERRTGEKNADAAMTISREQVERLGWEHVQAFSAGFEVFEKR